MIELWKIMYCCFLPVCDYTKWFQDEWHVGGACWGVGGATSRHWRWDVAAAQHPGAGPFGASSPTGAGCHLTP